MDELAIKVENITKIFKLPHEKANSIKSAVVGFQKRKKGYELQHALKDISFEVKKGEFFGIVGRNGSGKSTLLKLMAGIYEPTSGSISVNGSLTPFIELGVGFNPELTGRENIYLNGALLGFDRKHMRTIYKDIVEFAELEKFMDQKLKNYSSGMQVRLAFSIAIRAKNDILILDEVLAVGDEAFQRKCLDVFEDYKAKGQTVILVTHDMSIVREFCTRAMLINQGKVIMIGSPEKVSAAYIKINDEAAEGATFETNRENNSHIKLKIMNEHKKEVATLENDGKMLVEMSWPKAQKVVENLGIAIVKNTGEYIFGANTFGAPINLSSNRIIYEVKLSLGPGKYHLMAGLFGKSENDTIEFMDKGPEFLIRKNSKDGSRGITRFDHKWHIAK